jgi:hypothetical protein
LSYADDINLMGENINAIEKNIEIILDNSNEVALKMSIKEPLICSNLVIRMKEKILILI